MDLTPVVSMASKAVMVVGGLLALILVGALVVGGILFFFKWRRYTEYKCVVWEKDGFGHTNETYDKAGIFVDKKTKNKRFYMKRANVGLNPDNVPFVPNVASGMFAARKTVYLLRTGLKNFQFIQPEIGNPHIDLNVGEEDVNWAVNAYEGQKVRFAASMLLQYLPFILLGFVSIIILILFIYLFNKLDILRDIMQASVTAANALKAGGATVI